MEPAGTLAKTTQPSELVTSLRPAALTVRPRRGVAVALADLDDERADVRPELPDRRGQQALLEDRLRAVHLRPGDGRGQLEVLDGVGVGRAAHRAAVVADPVRPRGHGVVDAGDGLGLGAAVVGQRRDTSSERRRCCSSLARLAATERERLVPARLAEMSSTGSIASARTISRTALTMTSTSAKPASPSPAGRGLRARGRSITPHGSAGLRFDAHRTGRMS